MSLRLGLRNSARWHLPLSDSTGAYLADQICFHVMLSWPACPGWVSSALRLHPVWVYGMTAYKQPVGFSSGPLRAQLQLQDRLLCKTFVI